MVELYEPTTRQISIAQVGQSRKYLHRFGGSLEDFGFKVEGGHPLHLVWLMDTADPLCLLPLKRRFIPLCYGFQFGGCATAYRLKQKTIQLLSPASPRLHSNFPYSGYPKVFEAQSLTLKRLPYNPKDPESALMNSAFFGLEHVPTKTLSKIAQRLDQFGDWDDLELGDVTREDYLRAHPSHLPLMQGIPNTKCIYPQCTRFGYPNAMQICAYHPGYPAEYEKVMWGPNVDGVSLIFQICTHCDTIYVSNQTT